MSDEAPIEKCAAIILDAGRLLVVRKRGTSIFISPGGKREDGEAERVCLRRELKEELNVELVTAEPFGIFERASAFEVANVRMSTWLTTVHGECKPGAEIEELKWVSAACAVPIGSVFSECVIPKLILLGLM